jgi:hypothetical protein
VVSTQSTTRYDYLIFFFFFFLLLFDKNLKKVNKRMSNIVWACPPKGTWLRSTRLFLFSFCSYLLWLYLESPHDRLKDHSLPSSVLSSGAFCDQVLLHARYDLLDLVKTNYHITYQFTLWVCLSSSWEYSLVRNSHLCTSLFCKNWGV